MIKLKAKYIVPVTLFAFYVAINQGLFKIERSDLICKNDVNNMEISYKENIINNIYQ